MSQNATIPPNGAELLQHSFARCSDPYASKNKKEAIYLELDFDIFSTAFRMISAMLSASK